MRAAGRTITISELIDTQWFGHLPADTPIRLASGAAITSADESGGEDGGGTLVLEIDATGTLEEQILLQLIDAVISSRTVTQARHAARDAAQAIQYEIASSTPEQDT